MHILITIHLARYAWRVIQGRNSDPNNSIADLQENIKDKNKNSNFRGDHALVRSEKHEQ
jgi:hypothetical protein